MTPQFTRPLRHGLILATLCLGATAAQADITRSIQGSGGHGVTINGAGSYDPATGSYGRNKSWTTNNGTTVTGTTTGSCTGGAGTRSCSSETTLAGPNGGTGTRSALRGGGSASITTTGPNGRSATRQRWITVNP